MGLIQTADQLRFSYLAILEGVQQLAEGNTKFMPDVDEDLPLINGQKGIKEENESTPEPPKRIASLPPCPSTLTNEEGYRRIIEDGLPNRPLPDVPSSEEESSEDDDLVDESESASDEDTSTSKSYGLLIDVRNNPPSSELPIPDDIETLPLPGGDQNPTGSSTTTPEDTSEVSTSANSYHKSPMPKRRKTKDKEYQK
jgi:hypothetical protein